MKYQIAMYIRLSKEDDKIKEETPYGYTSIPYGAHVSCSKKEESNSITMQRILLKKYIAENFADYELSEFCDDGYTGTNLNRPGMQEMLGRIKNGEINCVVVKDFSRFARDYIELGSYLEQIFPFLGVRFISINDKYDSNEYQGSIADIDMNFKNLLYDLYSKDLSGKVRSSLAIRKEKGQYVSANCPFGYEKDPKDRHMLLIAEDEAEVVRKIFTLTAEGHTSIEIAKIFNKDGIKTPIEFKIEKGRTSRIPKGERFLWSGSTICQILRNEIYIGNAVQKKYTKDSVGGRNHLNPQEEWLITQNHHEPIIDKDVFDKVQEKRGKKRPPQYRQTHPLIGKLVCGCCKKNLRYRAGLNPYFSCSYRYSNTMENCVGKVNAMFLEQYILFMMQDKLQEEGELEKLCTEEMCQLDRTIKKEKEKRQDLAVRLEKLKQQNFETYQNYVNGKTNGFQSEDDMVKSLQKEMESLDVRLHELETDYFGLKEDKESKCVGSQFAKLSKEMIECYIDKIEVYDEQHIKIQWREHRVAVSVS